MNVEFRYITADGTAFVLRREAVVHELEQKLYKYFAKKEIDIDTSITYQFAQHFENLSEIYRYSVEDLEEQL